MGESFAKPFGLFSLSTLQKSPFSGVQAARGNSTMECFEARADVRPKSGFSVRCTGDDLSAELPAPTAAGRSLMSAFGSFRSEGEKRAGV